MAHIVYLSAGISSNLNASFELARRLRSHGHTVTYASAKDVRERVEAQGLPFVSLEERRKRPRPSGHRSRWLHLLRLPTFIRERRGRAAQGFNTEASLERLRELEPDLLLIDLELHPYVIATASLKVPVVLMMVWFSIWKRPGLPPLHLDLIPEDSMPGRLKLEAVWFKYRLNKWLKRQREKATKIGVDQVSVLRTLARRSDFPFAREAEPNEWLIPISYRTLPVLSLNAWELEFPHPPRPNLVYTGPMIHRTRREPETDSRFREVLDRLVQQRQADPEQVRPLIYCSLGTFWSADTNFLQRVLQAVEQRPDWDLILGLGNRLKPEALAPLPPNAYVFGWVPQLQVLEHADCALTHGGISTINECIWFGVPMVVYSTRKIDQNGCAARVAYHGIGLMADKDRDDAAAIRSNLERVLTDSSFKTNVERLRERFHTYENEERGVAFIESLLEKH